MHRLAYLCLVACGSPSPKGWRVPSEDALFHQEPRWLGADGAYTIDLGSDRTLWLFGDSFIATSPAHVRTEATLVRNSVAVMTGRDPLTATMQFSWTDGSPPSAFFPDAGDHWFWPADGVRVPGGPLIVLLTEQQPTPGQGLGFASAGWRAVRITDPDAPPATWTLEPVATRPAPYAADAAIACSAVDGEELIAVVVDGPAHDGRLARWPLTAVDAGDLLRPAWWTAYAVVAEELLVAPPAVVIPDGSTECSLARDFYGDWYYIQSRGFGASTIALRRAFEIEGEWSRPQDMITPPESGASN